MAARACTTGELDVGARVDSNAVILVLADGVRDSNGIRLRNVKAVSVLATVVIAWSLEISTTALQKEGSFGHIPSDPSIVMESMVRSLAPLIDTTWWGGFRMLMPVMVELVRSWA